MSPYLSVLRETEPCKTNLKISLPLGDTAFDDGKESDKEKLQSVIRLRFISVKCQNAKAFFFFTENY